MISATDEQKKILETVKNSADNLLIAAFAGSGKTTTLQMIAEELSDKKGLYLAYNKSILEEARRKFPKNIICKTTHGLAFVMALLGTSKLIKKKGLQFCLLFYPVVLAIGIILFMIAFKFGNLTPYQTLGAVFGLTALGKGLSYAVNNPVKEMMYIPTSKDAKYKAKSWIETFGSRGSKAAGGSICKNIAKGGLDAVMIRGNMIGLAIIGVWTAAAVFVGRKNAELIKEGKIVE